MLSFALLQNLSLNLSMLDRYNTNPAKGVDNNELQIRSSLEIYFLDRVQKNPLEEAARTERPWRQKFRFRKITGYCVSSSSVWTRACISLTMGVARTSAFCSVWPMNDSMAKRTAATGSPL